MLWGWLGLLESGFAGRFAGQSLREAEEKKVLLVRKWDAVLRGWAALGVAGGDLQLCQELQQLFAAHVQGFLWLKWGKDSRNGIKIAVYPVQ